MIDYKYVDVCFVKPNDDIQSVIFLFDGSFQHKDILSLTADHCNIDYKDTKYLSAGHIRLNSQCYVTFGHSSSLDLDSHSTAGACFTLNALENGLEFMMVGRNIIVAMKGFFKMDRGFRGGSFTITQDASHPDLALVHIPNVIVYHRTTMEETLRIHRAVERLINCGNTD